MLNTFCILTGTNDTNDSDESLSKRSEQLEENHSEPVINHQHGNQHGESAVIVDGNSSGEEHADDIHPAHLSESDTEADDFNNVNAGPDNQPSDGGSEGEDDGQHEDYGWDFDDDVPLYDMAPITVGESALAILSFYLKHNLPQTALSDMLELVDLHCRQEGNRFTKSLHQFKKYFANVQFPIVRHYYCSVCFKRCPSGDAICPNHNEGNDFFIQIPLIPQLKALYKRPGFREKLNHKITRTKLSNDNYEEIYDGTVYKELSQPGEILSDPRNISLSWYADGVSIFKSSKSELWPFYLTINELPYNDRAKVSNALLTGIWFGKVKPQPGIFLEPLRADVTRLHQGVNLSWGINPVHDITVKATVMCGTADIPAKALFLDFKGHNGTYGCAKCKIQSVNIRRGLNIYPYRGNLEARTEEETTEHAREALELPAMGGSPADVFGVKGLSILSTFVHKYVQSVAVDVMHCAYLGVMKALMMLWFDAKYKDKDFSLRSYTNLVNQRLSKISPPSFVQRFSRTLNDIKYWKAHELKAFLYYYSVPVVRDLLPDLHFDHHKHLVLGLYLLNQRSVSEHDINVASDVLKEYCGLFEDLYGIENMTCNLHQLLHLPDIVRKFGPLWVTSCFPYEDMNGKLKKLVKGTRYAELQVCSGVSMLVKFAELINHIPANSRGGQFITAISDKNRRIKTVNISPRFSIVGKVTKKFVLPAEFQEAINESGAEGQNYFEFYRLMKYSVIIASQIYEEKKLKTKTM